VGHRWQRRWRSLIAVALPALALVATFPVLHPFVTVYNEPGNPVPAFLFAAALALLPGVALAVFVRNRWPFSIGVVLSVAAAVIVAFQIATLDDGQAGLAILQLPVFMSGALAIAVVVDAITRSTRRSAAGAPCAP